ncbi:carboxypeptidase S3, penicillopeptidase S3, CPD-S3 [Mollisia scopiformis]|uniref:Carboxypeptidase n=1 Tax=Mollisia scopiformis TaxID=149040 RepID=A0A194WW76_MOLSC|nr:carboxypeptidase S3, penicillopeptidase S3, CPD-S3 [Mollisia scopiformis]KUJ12228.1 carboxypeptidase S3, penicillopeptidase S3, CPD-S3 [Mollisia scopiformis]
MMLTFRFQWVLLAWTAFLAVASGRLPQSDRVRRTHPPVEARHEAPEAPVEDRSEKFRFLTAETKPYQVTSLPEVPFDIGELYSGLVPIDSKNKSNALFFVFQPTIGPPVDTLTIWLNGGPGCSSLEGFFQENGRFLWQPGQYAPAINDYAWVNLTNMLWVEQPIGTGFSIGEVTATGEEEIAQQFVGFFKNFEELFGIKHFKIYVTGESYAGRYVPYISAAMVDEKDTTYFDLAGVLVYDPCIGAYDYSQQELVTLPLVQRNAPIFGLNDSFISQLEALDASCGYADYRNKYLTFPPPGIQPDGYFSYETEASCDVWDLTFYAALAINPCFNIYHIVDTCPLLPDVLGFPGSLMYTTPGLGIYFERADVKKAMHAPTDVTWTECSNGLVIIGAYGPDDDFQNDTSLDPIQYVLPKVIEHTNRVLVANGDWDMIIITEGTLLSIQNMTWNGALGFQTEPSTPIVITEPDLQYEVLFDENELNGVDDIQGTMGIQHYERGLMWAETYQSGHMEPEYQPRISYRHLEWLLGYVDEL